MNLNEYASALSENARKITVDHRPVLESTKLMVDTMERMIASLPDPMLGEELSRMLGEIKNVRDEFVNKFPREMEQLKKSIVKSADETADHLREFQITQDKGIDKLRRLEEELVLRQQQPPKSEHSSTPIEPAATEPDFSPGDVLLEGLLGLSKPKPPVKQTIRTSGNIWEDWGKPAK